MYVFLSGAEMQPERVRVDWPAARFVARGRLSPSAPRDEIWGIVIEATEAAGSGAPQGAIADDGRAFRVVVPAPDAADPGAVLAAARYWELPPDYVRHLARLANAPVEEYVY